MSVDCDEEDKFSTIIACKDEKKTVFRAALCSEADANEWMTNFKEETFTGWIVFKVQKEKDCQR